MKNVLFAVFVLAAGSTSFAEVKAPGTFVPYACSGNNAGTPTAEAIAVSRVCVGKIVDTEQQVVKVSINDGSTRMYAVKMEKHIDDINNGMSKSNFRGTVMVIRMRDEIRGELTRVSGVTLSYELRFKTTSGLSFAGPMVPQWVTE